jgi:hypothetical protein
VPLAWSPDALLWVAASEAGWELQRIPFDAALPVRVGSVPPGTLAVRMDGDTLRLLVWSDQLLTVRDAATGSFLLTIDDVPLAAPLGAAWQGNTLLLATEQHLWALNFPPEALR